MQWTLSAVCKHAHMHSTCTFRSIFLRNYVSTTRSLGGKGHVAITREDQITHISTTVSSQVLIYTAGSTGALMERTKMPKLRNGSKGDSNLANRAHSIASPAFYCWAVATQNYLSLVLKHNVVTFTRMTVTAAGLPLAHGWWSSVQAGTKLLSARHAAHAARLVARCPFVPSDCLRRRVWRKETCVNSCSTSLSKFYFFFGNHMRTSVVVCLAAGTGNRHNHD